MSKDILDGKNMEIVEGLKRRVETLLAEIITYAKKLNKAEEGREKNEEIKN